MHAVRSIGPVMGPSTPRVLIVDDELSITRALEIACTRAGYEVRATTSADDAQRILGAERIDVLLLDLRMPDVRGDVLFHLASALQPHLLHQTVFITGDVSDRGQELIGACHAPFVRKPFDLGDVLQTIQALLPVAATA